VICDPGTPRSAPVSDDGSDMAVTSPAVGHGGRHGPTEGAERI
jgi:hypothetical protein